MAITCPSCKLINPYTALRCDCGYSFEPISGTTTQKMAPPQEFDRPVDGILLCRHCGLISPPDAERCDCGYFFRLIKKNVDSNHKTNTSYSDFTENKTRLVQPTFPQL